MNVLVGAFNQEKALIGAFSLIVKTDGSSATLKIIILVLVPVQFLRFCGSVAVFGARNSWNILKSSRYDISDSILKKAKTLE